MTPCEKLFVLVFKRDDGYDGGLTSINLFISSNTETLEAKKDVIINNRLVANDLLDTFYKELEADEKIVKARIHSVRSKEEMSRIDIFHKELDEKYPFWNVGGRRICEDDNFDIEEVDYI